MLAFNAYCNDWNWRPGNYLTMTLCCDLYSIEWQKWHTVDPDLLTVKSRRFCWRQRQHILYSGRNANECLLNIDIYLWMSNYRIVWSCTSIQTDTFTLWKRKAAEFTTDTWHASHYGYTGIRKLSSGMWRRVRTQQHTNYSEEHAALSVRVAVDLTELRTSIPLSSAWRTLLSWRWRQYIPPKSRYNDISL
jgi:hypothetical protein